MIPRIGVLTVRGGQYHPTKRLIEAAKTRSAQVIPINPYNIAPAYDQNQPVLCGRPDADGVQAVLPRQGAEIKTACLPLIAHLEQMGVRMINGFRSIQIARNKFFMLQTMTRTGLPVPDTVYATSVEGCRQARHHLGPGPVVLKPIRGRQGTGLHCLPPGADLPPDVKEQLAVGNGVLVQTFIPPHRRRDIRALVIGRRVAGAVSLQPVEGDFRSNVHIGGRPQALSLDQTLAGLAIEAADAMQLEIAGVDLMIRPDNEPAIIEINSAPGFRAMEAVTGHDIAGAMLDYTLSVI
jgi:ribosomal protein S6--L-glutamate ligase